MPTAIDNEEKIEWYVMRSLQRANAKKPLYKTIEEKGFTVFTPTKAEWKTIDGKRTMVERPAIPDMFFVQGTATKIKDAIKKMPLVQFRFVRGGVERKMTVRDADMARFVNAVGAATSVEYRNPSEISPNMIGKKIRLKGGPLDGEEVTLLKTQGTTHRRIIVALPNLVVAIIDL